MTPGVERWFDGTDWSEHTRPVWAAPVPVAPPSPAASAYGAAPYAAVAQASPYGEQYPATGVVGVQPWPGQQAPGQQLPGQQAPGQQWAGQPWPGQPGVAPQWPAQQGSMASSGPTNAVHWMLPVGRSWQSITAGYVGLLALGIWVLGPVAIWLGIWAMQKASAGGHGRGRAIFAIITGTLGTVFMGLFLLARSQL